MYTSRNNERIKNISCRVTTYNNKINSSNVAQGKYRFITTVVSPTHSNPHQHLKSSDYKNNSSIYSAPGILLLSVLNPTCTLCDTRNL